MQARNTNFKLTVIVDSTPEEGCLLSVFIDDRYVCSVALEERFDATEDNAVMFWTQYASSSTPMDIRLDNITVKNYKAK